ncbi:MAG: hypothetical protein DHS20C20_02530 [Ardenticatenaceae bacterium]|nr:MAG: hypothetical protein DHS20C20_02530 [Ardenticatenaceae bacterium]
MDDASPTVGTVLRYVGLTAVSLLLLIVTTRAIGQAPLLQFGGANALLPSWQPVTDGKLQFSLNMPETWAHFEMVSLPQEDEATIAPVLIALEQRLTRLVADGGLVMIGLADTAVSNPDPAFVLISSSHRLTRLTPEQFLAYAQQESPETVEFLDDSLITNNPGPARAQLRFNLQSGNGRWRCLEQFIHTESIVYLATACTPDDQFSTYHEDFETILRSFQPLES